ncbi:AzlD domain-containing protein [Glutamicibacter soli]|uniref:AzlD domain-containing protein n=1 Tax=Glutamicibacter soli TaxID=453836 RepID=A0A365YB80_9MICC|nr:MULTISPECIES: AzlD domain-containing protein [Micrococcaceae]ALD62747.1 branched-chain amino acid transporter AzlD [Arthrobacter sp. LS16]ALQ32096.1 branched-chain amino acid transporter AzlD [Arthrobacter sp. YC-RL1]KLI90391.1 branched-chain amino acid transporter AzlD [Arthrobacter sp. YC-RL1]NAZ17643.1 AzlD domain-containing protein [Glutamicibacter soli]RBL99954.1 branched-chain amino acid transporter AzlD [Glutamicibacter soli]
MSELSWWILAACLTAYAIKICGYFVPRKVLDSPTMSHVAATLTIALLASLVTVNAFTSGQELVIDARIGALAAAVVALVFKAPYLVVVIAGALAAVLLRATGLAA